jgi:hypothetical protein
MKGGILLSLSTHLLGISFRGSLGLINNFSELNNSYATQAKAKISISSL